MGRKHTCYNGCLLRVCVCACALQLCACGGAALRGGHPLPLPNARLRAARRHRGQRSVWDADFPECTAAEDAEGRRLQQQVGPRGLSGGWTQPASLPRVECAEFSRFLFFFFSSLHRPLQAGAQISLADDGCSEERSARCYNLLSRSFISDIGSKDDEVRAAGGSDMVHAKLI